jgi:arylsulfatase A-like enzyme
MLPPRALPARGALLGALGGASAGAVDFVLAAGRVGAFLPVGKWKLLVFLCTLYGALGGLGGALLGLVLFLLGRTTDLGKLWRAAFAGEESVGARWVAYAVATLGALGGAAWILDLVALEILRHYHHRLLMAALVGAAATGLTLGAAVIVFVAAALLSLALRFGPRARLRFTVAAGVAAPSWILTLYLVGGGVAALLYYLLLSRPAMLPAFKALNVALWLPAIVLAAVALTYALCRRLRRFRGRLATPRGALLAVAAALLAPLALTVAVQWPLVRQLDLRPFIALGVLIVFMLLALFFDLGTGLATQPRWQRAATAIVLPLVLLSLALATGRLDRVRKAAISFTGAAGPLVGALQTATDLDGDGYSSILGGGDCNDFDREVHPGAFDWPDDGIDQDCNGHEATLQPAPPAPFAALPPSLPRDLNVVLITIDALRADHVGAYGYPRATTPRLDALAAESALFTDAWAHAPSTRYSIPAILTGRYPSAIAQDASTRWPPRITNENRLLSEMLKDRGYHTGVTASYGGSGYFEESWGMFQGFDETDTHLKSLHSLAGDPSNTRGTSSRQLADLDIDWISKNKDKKFFFWTHFYDTHFGFEPHPDLPESHFGSSELDLYDGEIRFTDFHIGRVFDALKAAGLWDKTILVITADHGDGFGEHGIPPNQRHGYHLYGNETRVPLIIRIPGLPAKKIFTPAGHVDIVPTILNAIGARAGDEPTLLGKSRLGLISGSAPDDLAGAIFQEVTYEGPSNNYNGTQRRAVVTHDWHFIRNLIPDGTRELYRRSVDPLEEHDISGLGEPAEAELSRELAAWMDSIALPPDFAAKVSGNLARKPFAPRQPLTDKLGNYISIDGIDIDNPQLKAGATTTVSVYMHALGPIPDGWRLFLHAQGDRRMLNLDHAPLENLYPLQRFKSDMYVRDKVRLTLPADWAPGPLRLYLGLWKGPARAPAHGPEAQPDSSVLLGTITVQAP